MRIGCRSNLTVCLLRQQFYGELGVAAVDLCQLHPPMPDRAVRTRREQDRIDLVHPGPATFGYGPTARKESDNVVPPPPAEPNPVPQPADVLDGGVLNLYA